VFCFLGVESVIADERRSTRTLVCYERISRDNDPHRRTNGDETEAAAHLDVESYHSAHHAGWCQLSPLYYFY